MPLEIKSPDGKKLLALAIVGNTTRCGSCAMPCLDGQPFWMLDEPYNCIVHEHCLRMFQYNGKPRSLESKGRSELEETLTTDEEVISQYMTRKWFQTRLPAIIREAWIRVYSRALMLRRLYSPNAIKGWRATVQWADANKEDPETE